MGCSDPHLSGGLGHPISVLSGRQPAAFHFMLTRAILMRSLFQKGKLPLIVALQRSNTPERALLALIHASWPTAVTDGDSGGRLAALRVALQKNPSLPQVVMEALIAVAPERCRGKQFGSNSLLHFALKEGASSGSLKALVAAWPDALLVKDDGSEKIPLQIALESKCDDSVLSAMLGCLQMQQFGISAVAKPFDAGAAFAYKALLPVSYLRERCCTPATLQVETARLPNPCDETVVATAAKASAKFREMIAAQPQHLATAPLSERLACIKDVLNICLQTELSIAPTKSDEGDFSCKLYMKMHVDPAITLIKQELDALKDQVSADPAKYRRLLAKLSDEDRTIYNASFEKTINCHFGGDEAAYTAMLAKCDALSSLRPLVEVHQQPTTELVPLVLMVRANIPEFIRVVNNIVELVKSEVAAAGGTKAPPLSSIFRGETKAIYRIIEKSLTKGPNRAYPDCSKVFDIFGCIVECEGYASMAAVIQAFGVQHNSGALDMSRVKDRWTTPSDGGWRDFMLNVVINDVVFEVQLVLRSMYAARTVLDAHRAYNQFRSFNEVFDMLALPTKLDEHPSGSSTGSVAGGTGRVDVVGEDDPLKQRLEASEAARVVVENTLAAERADRAAEREDRAVAEVANTKKRRAAEARVTELEAEIKRLRSSSSNGGGADPKESN